jgi:PAS domain S-box-containing protein
MDRGALVKIVIFLTKLRRPFRLQGPLANNSTAGILHVLVSALIIWLTVSTLLVYLFTAVVARLNLFLVPSLLVILVVVLVLLRLGFLRAASMVYLSGMFFYVTMIMVLTGGLRNAPALVFYAALPISAAWLLGYRATLWMAGLCTSSALILTLLDLGGVRLHPYLPAKPLAAWSFLVMAILVAALPAAQVLRTLQNSLAQSHRSEAALWENQQRLASIYDTVRDVIFHLAVEPGGKFRFASVNAAFLRVTGLSEEAVVGRTVNEVIPDPSLTMVLGKYRQAITEHTTVVWEETSDYPTGELTGEVSITPVFDNTGRCTHLIGSVHDLTERKRAEATLRRGQEESFARQKLESVGTLASGIAHDFNNLLGAVLGQAELALGELAAGSRPEEELKTIRNVAIRGSEIVRQLMIYAGKDNEIPGLVDVSQIAKEMLELLKVSVSRHATLETELGQDLPAVRMTAAQVRRVLMNLVTNASEALGERDGVIRVTTKCVRVSPDTSAWISDGLADGVYLQLEVTDNGCGMSPETQARVFDPFFTTKSAGHGLGLSVVSGIVRSLGGTTHVASESGKGTSFQVLLPCAEAKAETTNEMIMSGCEESTQPSEEYTVLVVEDEAPLRQAVVKRLRRTGFEVLEAPDGSAAIDVLKINADKLDVILLDVTIPGASSAQVLAEVAQSRSDIRVILTSAYSQEMVTAVLCAPQVCGFLRKPFQLVELETTLRRAASAA